MNFSTNNRNFQKIQSQNQENKKLKKGEYLKNFVHLGKRENENRETFKQRFSDLFNKFSSSSPPLIFLKNLFSFVKWKFRRKEQNLLVNSLNQIMGCSRFEIRNLKHQKNSLTTNKVKKIGFHSRSMQKIEIESVALSPSSIIGPDSQETRLGVSKFVDNKMGFESQNEQLLLKMLLKIIKNVLKNVIEIRFFEYKEDNNLENDEKTALIQRFREFKKKIDKKQKIDRPNLQNYSVNHQHEISGSDKKRLFLIRKSWCIENLINLIVELFQTAHELGMSPSLRNSIEKLGKSVFNLVFQESPLHSLQKFNFLLKFMIWHHFENQKYEKASEWVMKAWKCIEKNQTESKDPTLRKKLATFLHNMSNQIQIFLKIERRRRSLSQRRLQERKRQSSVEFNEKRVKQMFENMIETRDITKKPAFTAMKSAREVKRLAKIMEDRLGELSQNFSQSALRDRKSVV